MDSRVLVIDIGGSHVKCFGGSPRRERRFKSGPKLTPEEMVEGVHAIFGRHRFARVSIGYPGAVRQGRPEREPVNLGEGWIGFDFDGAEFTHVDSKVTFEVLAANRD